jgi:hypothetical protein
MAGLMLLGFGYEANMTSAEKQGRVDETDWDRREGFTSRL